MPRSPNKDGITKEGRPRKKANPLWRTSPRKKAAKPKEEKMKLALTPKPDQTPAPVLDWSVTPLSVQKYYEGSYVKVIDDLFTPEECAALIALAESDAEWAQAAVHYGLGAHQQYVDTDYRNSERILRFDHDAAAQIYQRLLPHVQELVELKPGDPWRSVVSPLQSKRVQEGVWRLDG
ncbi:hypothetical protein NMY22_g4857 [Coprinellus aureogranulatus]|nr:hypothetical protein NMY22_g4857 [Coprinellus aureogranulatus]